MDSANSARVKVGWIDSSLVASDGISGFEVETVGLRKAVFSSPIGRMRISPGERIQIGWLRLSAEDKLSVGIVEEETTKQ